MVFVNRGKDLNELWVNGLSHIITHGDEVINERGSKVLEYCSILSEIPIKKIGGVPTAYPLKDSAVKEYENAMINPKKNGFTYTYGNRFREFFGVDQIECVIEKLKTGNTRRAYMTTWDPERDLYESEVPCLVGISFQNSGNRLFVSGVWRSHDFYGAFPANLIALRKMCGYVSRETNIPMGLLNVLSINAHIYGTDYEQAKKIVQKEIKRQFYG